MTDILAGLAPAPAIQPAAPLPLPPLDKPTPAAPVKRGRGRPPKSEAKPAPVEKITAAPVAKPAAPVSKVDIKTKLPDALAAAFSTVHAIAAKRDPKWAITDAEAQLLGAASADVVSALAENSKIELPAWAEPVIALLIVASSVYVPRILSKPDSAKIDAPAAN